MEDIKSVLLSLKEQALEATKNADADFYKDYLDESAIAIVPFGIFDKNTIMQQMGSANSQFKSSRIDDTRAIVLTPESGIVTYKATYIKADQTSFEVFVTTVYAKRSGVWKGVFYQQTPILKTK
ncbi:MAG: nuclear transport factor 2 family protein [Bacteroidales bacterium]|nr:nuclear transport factor 2 family protein [Bacteroidales bacterium]